MNIMKYANRLSFLSLCFIILSVLIFSMLACTSPSKETADVEPVSEPTEVIDATSYTSYFQQMEQDVVDRLLVDFATYVLRKPEHANPQTKFNPEFREYFEKKSAELEWIYALDKNDTVYFYLIRDGRDHKGKSNRGVGGKMVLNPSCQIEYFEELFVSKIIDRNNLEALGQRFMKAIENSESIASFIENPNSSVEWPDGRLFYSVQKSEWRYVD